MKLVNAKLWGWAGLILLLGVWTFVAFNARSRELNADEGFYLAASKAALQGELPYRDYAYTMMPLLPILQAPLLAYTGFSLSGLRLAMILTSTLALLVAYCLTQRRWMDCLLLLLLPLAPHATSFLCIGKTYAMAQLLLLLSAAAFLIPAGSRIRLLWLCFFGVLAVGVRLTMGPSVGVLGLAFWWLYRKELRWMWFLTPFILTMLILGPFVFSDPALFLFWNWQYHMSTLVARHDHNYWRALLSFAPGIYIVLTGGLYLAIKEKREFIGSVFFLAAFIGVIANVFVGVYDEYVTPFLLLGLVGLSRVVIWNRIGKGLVIVGLVVSCLCFHLAPDEKSCESARDAAMFLKAHTKATDVVLATMPEVPIEAGRPLYKNLVMGKFTLNAEMSDKAVHHLKMVTPGDVVSAIQSRAPAAVVWSTAYSSNFDYTLPSLRIMRPEWRKSMFAELEKNYYQAYHNKWFVIYLLGKAPRELPRTEVRGIGAGPKGLPFRRNLAVGP